MAKFYYNNVLLPEIPSDVLTSYPYAVIMKNTDSGNYDLCLGSGIWWYLSGKLYHDNIPYITSYRYTVPIATSEDATEWEYAYAGKVNGYSVDDTNSIVWSNHNILLDSSTSIRTYFYGSDPVPEETEEPETVTQYLIRSDTLTAIADGFRSSRETTKKYTLDEMAVLAAEKTSGGGSMFASNASGRIPEYERGTALSEFTLDFESSAVGTLEEV